METDLSRRKEHTSPGTIAGPASAKRVCRSECESRARNCRSPTRGVPSAPTGGPHGVAGGARVPVPSRRSAYECDTRMPLPTGAGTASPGTHSRGGACPLRTAAPPLPGEPACAPAAVPAMMVAAAPAARPMPCAAMLLAGGGAGSVAPIEMFAKKSRATSACMRDSSSSAALSLRPTLRLPAAARAPAPPLSLWRCG